MAGGKMILAYKAPKGRKLSKRVVRRVPTKKLVRYQIKKYLNAISETKELTWKCNPNVNIAHNQIFILNNGSGNPLNPFEHSQGTQDTNAANQGVSIGDSITAKGLLIRGFFENAIDRSRVHYRVMLLRCAKGDVPTRATLFKGSADNKVIDQLNTERYKIIAAKNFTINQQSVGSTTVSGVNGIPTGGSTLGGQGTRAIKMWIPGHKFARYGKINYESNSLTQVKYFDYRVVVFAYDW